jgi:transcriptional regulator with XRE-family HTH domain
MFIERIKQLREERRLPLRKLTATLDIDSATCWKTAKGERRAKKEYISVIAELLQTDYEELLKLWLADQVVYEIADEQLGIEALRVAEGKVKYNVKNK